MKRKSQSAVKDGVKCKVTAGTHAGKAGIVSDINTSKTGHVTITVTQKKWGEIQNPGEKYRRSQTMCLIKRRSQLLVFPRPDANELE